MWALIFSDKSQPVDNSSNFIDEDKILVDDSETGHHTKSSP